MSFSFASLFKYSLFFIAVLSILISCNKNESQDEDDLLESEAEKMLESIEMGDFEVVKIEGCQYVVFTSDFGVSARGYGFMAHKGNCNNPIHIYNTPQDTLDQADLSATSEPTD